MSRLQPIDPKAATAGPFHQGELQMQKLAGGSKEAELNSPMISSRIARGAAPFLTERFLAVFGIENEGSIWSTFMTGAPGFVTVPEQTSLIFDLRKTESPIDPMILTAAKKMGAAGTIFIDLRTRMRYCINGRLSQPDPNRIELKVREAYGNCPKYITRRTVNWDTASSSNLNETYGDGLSSHQITILRNADLFFMATGHPERGFDASHRGGSPGFITVVNDKSIRFPDYPGNSLYNSLGNLLVDNRIGILVPDWKRRRALRITGTASIQFQNSGRDITVSNAPRIIDVSVSRWSEIDLPFMPSGAIEYSPYNP